MDISEFSRLEDKSQYQRHPWETSRKNALLTFLKQSGISFPVDRIVDIGSGDAYVIHTLVEKKLAKQYFAIDIEYNQEVITQLKMNNNNSVVAYYKTIEAFNANEPKNDSTLYLCMDVLEHLENEGEILKHLNSHHQKSHYFFAVPAFQSVFSSHDVLLGHYRRYSLEELKAVLKSYQFDIIEEGYYFSSLLFARKLERFLKKEKKESIDNWSGGAVKTSLINLMLTIDFGLTLLLKKVGIKIPGLSCYCLCKK